MEDSPLHRLPAELRNEIFEYALILALPITGSISDGKVHLSKRKQLLTGVLGLTATCRQLRREAHPIVHGSLKCRIWARNVEPGQVTAALRDWLRTGLGAHAAQRLREVELQLDYMPEELVQHMPALSRLFGDERLRLTLDLQVIYAGSGWIDWAMFPLRVEVQGGKLDAERWESSVEAATLAERQRLEKMRGDVSEDLWDVQYARSKLLGLPSVLAAEYPVLD